MPGCFGRIFVNCEVPKRVDRIALLTRLDDEFLRKLPVGESRQAQHARRVGCRQIATELISEAMQKRLCILLRHSRYFPHDLVLAGRGIEDKVWSWHCE